MHGISDGWYPEHRKHFTVLWEGEKKGFHCQVVEYESQGPWVVEYLVRTFIFLHQRAEPIISFDVERSIAGVFYSIQEPGQHVLVGPAEGTTFADYDSKLEKWFEDWTTQPRGYLSTLSETFFANDN